MEAILQEPNREKIPGRPERARVSVQERLDSIPSLDEKTPEVFQWEAEDFFHAQKEAIDRAIEKQSPNPLADARKELMEKHVLGAEFRELGQLCHILLLVPIFTNVESELEQLYRGVRDLRGSSDPVDRRSLHQKKEQAKEMKLKLIGFNHLLRDFLIENGDCIERSDLHNWFAKMNKNVNGPGDAVIKGVAAEVAVARAITKHGTEWGLGCRVSTIAEDKKGVDLVITKNGLQRPVDIKTGSQISYERTENEEINVEQNQIEGFDLSSEGIRDVFSQLSAL